MKGRNPVKGGKSKAAKRSAKPMPARPAKVRPAARGKRVGLDPPECAERLEFETLPTDLSARFIHLPVEQVDDAIVDAQRRIWEEIRPPMNRRGTVRKVSGSPWAKNKRFLRHIAIPGRFPGSPCSD